MTLEEIIKRNPNQQFKCELCGEIFHIKDTKLTEVVDGITDVSTRSRFLFARKDGEVVYSDKQPKKSEGDLVLTCPLCDAQHPYGFVAPPDPRIVREAGHA